MRFLTKRMGLVYFSAAWGPPWPEAALVAVLAAFAGLSLAGVSLPPAGLPALVPAMTASLSMFAVLYRLQSGVGIVRDDQVNLLLWVAWRGNRSLDLDELAAVAREPAGLAPALTVTGIRRDTLTIPLGRWKDEERLLAEIDRSVADVGATGSVGEVVPVRKPLWVRPVRIALIAAATALVFVLQSEVDAVAAPGL